MNLKKLLGILTVALWLPSGSAQAQMVRPPAFFGGVPGMAQMQAVAMQRHQARTLLYREALEELRKNPAAADVKECPAGEPKPGEVCIRAVKKEVSAEPAAGVQAEAEKSLTESVEKTQQAAVRPPRRKIAVLVGNNAYPAPIPVLETPISDVQDIGKLLQERFGYEVRIVRDARKSDVVEALNQVGAEAGRDDSVLVVYAGHGYLMDDTGMGYWIPVDGSTKSAANWISNSDISKFLASIPAMQLILISDSCFSGSLTREQKIVAASGLLKKEDILKRRSVMVMSSGGEEPVSDEGKDGHSIFAYSLIQTLNAVSEMMPGIQVYQQVKNGVTKEYSQEPQYGAAVSAGHASGGEFLFDPSAN